MNHYKIYENQQRMQEVVKIGFSWPGFFFSWLWCFIKGLVSLGFTI